MLPTQGASCLSAKYVWQQLMPEFAALVRSLCVAWRRGHPRCPSREAWQRSQGTRSRPWSCSTPCAPHCVLRCACAWPPVAFLLNGLPTCAEAVFTCSATNMVIWNVLRRTFVQHVVLCTKLYERAASPVLRTLSRACSLRRCARRQPATCSVGPWRKGSAKVTHMQSIRMRMHMRVVAAAAVRAERI